MLVLSSPHSGEKIPKEASWLEGLDEVTLMYDIDRYIDQLYGPVAEELELPFLKADWHRYAVDLNRLPTDINSEVVIGATLPSGSKAFASALHWKQTTGGKDLMPGPITKELHEALLKKCYFPFHNKLQELLDKPLKTHGKYYHVDLHSMPSTGTKKHRDPGENRAEIVISDQDGMTCSEAFKDMVVEAYKLAGFEVAYNWPYKGGRVVGLYGEPKKGKHSIQVELNRSVYMCEKTKKLKLDEAKNTQSKLRKAIAFVHKNIESL